MATNPEIGRYVTTGAVRTNYHDLGATSDEIASPLLLLHGSGPGVSAFANWRLVMPLLAEHTRVLAFDFAGFGYSETPADAEFSRDAWLAQLVDFLDDQVDAPLVLPILSMVDRRRRLHKELVESLAAEWPELLHTAFGLYMERRSR